jgi:formate dehydrogenase subunit gamma
LATDAIPVQPVPLTAAQAEAMLQRRLKKHHVAIILLHWFNAYVWLFELLTGLALLSSPRFRVVPAWSIGIVDAVFGSRARMLDFHVALGVVWIVVFVVYGVFGWRTYLGREVLRREVALDGDDLRWLVVRTRRILGLTREALPPQGVYNAGQKLFAMVVYAMVPVIMLTGLVMAFQLLGPAAIGWAAALHFAAVGVVASGLLIHVYMGAVFPEEKPAFFSMITGTVHELFAYEHHFKWWREMKLAEREWEARRYPPAVEPGPPPATETASAERGDRTGC